MMENNALNNIYVGTSGFDYPEWKGVFYPNVITRDDFLEYYSTVFNSVELNFTFYNIPDKVRMDRFVLNSKRRVDFAVKVNKALTHEKRSNWESIAKQFLESIDPLIINEKLNALLFQLPPYFSYTTENRIYLAKLLDFFKGLPLVVEFRNNEWNKDSVYDGMVKRNVSIAHVTMPHLFEYQGQMVTPFVGDIAYVRMHDRIAYSEEEMESFLPILNEAVKEGRKVMIYFAKYADDAGIGNATLLRRLTKDLIIQ